MNKINPLVIKELLQEETKYRSSVTESRLKAIDSNSSNSTNSSTFSVVDDDKNLILQMVAESNEIKEKLVTANEQAKLNSEKQAREIVELKAALAKVK